MKNILTATVLALSLSLTAQETVLPAKPQTDPIYIINAIIHVGNGTVIEKGTIRVEAGKIVAVGDNIPVPRSANIQVVDAAGKHVYPGLILPTSSLGLVEISAVRATQDAREIGDLNPNVRSLVAYNSDSKVINTLRSNGVLLANVVPQGNFVAGSSSLVQLDAWNWEDAAYQADGGIHVYFPSLMARPSGGRFGGGGGMGGPREMAGDPVKEGLEKIESFKQFLREAKAYQALPAHEQTNLKFEAVKGLLSKKQKLYVHGNTVKQILAALDFVQEFGVDLVIVGGSESYQVADLLKKYNVSVILQQPHSLPTSDDDDVDQPYKTAAALQKAGVLFSISDDDSQTRGRNLAFNAGTAAAYGLSNEEALASITLNAAKIIGVSDRTGSIEVGKDANILISEGDILDMKSSNVTLALIQGRQIDLTDKHKLLNRRFEEKYEINKAKKGF
ncbi:MAG: amidohydrolase family protein [Bacteroidota bacterium]